MKSNIYLFRHGQTDWNKEGRFQGHSDIPLNQAGIDEANELKTYVERLNPELIVSSDLQRALATARIVNSTMNLKIEVSQAIRETNLGEAEGQLRSDVDLTYGVEALVAWLSTDSETLDFGFPKGESKRQVITRVLSYLEAMLINNSIQKLAVSTHGGVIKRICHYISDMTTEQVPIKNCCLYELQFSHQNKKWSFVSQHK